MPLLLVRVDPGKILLVQRWQSDAMPQYLNTTTKSFTSGLSVCIIKHGDYTLFPPVHAGF